ncbi:MAG: hypothetical protein EPO68_03365, partial [Planctomycetota bacterium]
MPSKKAKPTAAKRSAVRTPARTGEPAQPPAPSGEIERIRALARAMSEGDLSELEIEDAQTGLRVRLRRGGEPAHAAPLQFVPGHAAPAAALAAA